MNKKCPAGREPGCLSMGTKTTIVFSSRSDMSYFSIIHLNINLPFTVRFPKWPLSLRFSTKYYRHFQFPIIFFDIEGIVHKELVLAGQTVNSAYYCGVL
jgi:hypothetical protein